MYDDLLEYAFWWVPFLASLSLFLALTYLFYKDRNKRKLMFAIGALLAAFGYYNIAYRNIQLKSLLLLKTQPSNIKAWKKHKNKAKNMKNRLPRTSQAHDARSKPKTKPFPICNSNLSIPFSMMSGLYCF